jgi:YHS domain-containing protein
MKKSVISLSVMFLVVANVFAQKSEVFVSSDAAIRGYDPVAYFSQGKPVKGSKEHAVSWNGATWYFSSAANQAAFKSMPEKYAPQYGGYCAYGLSQGHKAPIDPEAWTILDGKLYLNYSKDVKSTWDKDRPKYIQDANTNWPKIKDKE